MEYHSMIRLAGCFPLLTAKSLKVVLQNGSAYWSNSTLGKLSISIGRPLGGAKGSGKTSPVHMGSAWATNNQLVMGQAGACIGEIN